MSDSLNSIKKWLKSALWIYVIFGLSLGMFFVLLVLGVQYGDTYVGNDHPSFVSASKFVVKKVLHEVKNGIYHGATVYNPPGDTIPDDLDTKIIHGVKEIF